VVMVGCLVQVMLQVFLNFNLNAALQINSNGHQKFSSCNKSPRCSYNLKRICLQMQ